MRPTNRRTKRRYADEFYPHADEYEVRPLSVEVPYLYAQAIGVAVSETDWFDLPRMGEAGLALSMQRSMEVINARQKALLADALLQGLGGEDAGEWAESRYDEVGEWVYDRAKHYGVPVHLIKPYPILRERAKHNHMSSTGDVTGVGYVTRIDCRESECETCTEPVEVQQ